MISQCPSCKNQIQVPEAALGKKVRCSGCQAVFVVEANVPVAPAPKKKSEPPAPRKKKRTDALPAPKKPAPPPAPEPLDELEIIDESPPPAPQKKEPPKKKSAPKSAPVSEDSDNPFSFEGPAPAGGGASAGASPAPGLDFGDQQPTLNVDGRRKIRRAASLIYFGVFSCFFLSAVTTASALLVAMGNPVLYVIGNCPAALVLVFGIIVLQGARALAGVRSRGLCITAAVFCLLIALPGLGSVSLEVYAIINGGFHIIRAGFIAAMVASSVYCLLGGIHTLRIVFRADAAEAFKQSEESKRGADEKETLLTQRSMRGYAVKTSLCLAFFALWMLLTFGLGAAALLYATWPDVPGFVWLIVGGSTLFYGSAILTVLAAAGVTFGLRAPIVVNLGAIVCMGMAFLSYFGLLYVLFLVHALFLAPTPPTLQGLVVCQATALTVQLVLGFMAYGSAMRTARLIRRFQKGNLLQPPNAKKQTAEKK